MKRKPTLLAIFIGMQCYVPLVPAMDKTYTQIESNKINKTESNEALLDAVKKGHFNEVKKLIEETQTDVRLIYEKGKTLLHIAATHGHLNLVKTLLEHECGINAFDDNYQTPLLLAAKGGHLEVMQYLINNNAQLPWHINFTRNAKLPWNVHAPWKEYEREFILLCVAAKEGHMNIVEYFVEQEVDINALDNNYQTPLVLAAKGGHLEVVQYLINNNAQVLCKDYEREFTLLCEAAKEGHMNIVEYFVEQEVDINAVFHFDRSPLHLAAMGGDLDIVKYLIDKGADVNARDSDLGGTALHTAAQYGHLNIVQYLIEEAHAQVNIASNTQTILGNTKSWNVEEKNNVNAPNAQGVTPLHTAATFGHLDVVQYLIENTNLDVNAPDDQGYTPLHMATFCCSIDIIRYLIEKGANVNQVNDHEQTPVHIWARFSMSTDILTLLFKHNAQIDKKDKDGHTPEDIAKIQPCMENCLALLRRIQKRKEWIDLLNKTMDRLFFPCK